MGLGDSASEARLPSPHRGPGTCLDRCGSGCVPALSSPAEYHLDVIDGEADLRCMHDAGHATTIGRQTAASTGHNSACLLGTCKQACTASLQTAQMGHSSRKVMDTMTRMTDWIHKVLQWLSTRNFGRERWAQRWSIPEFGVHPEGPWYLVHTDSGYTLLASTPLPLGS